MKAASSKAAPKMDHPVLNYPLPKSPKTGLGDMVEIVPGLFWVRMPMESDLAAVNVWVADDGEALSIIDTGLHNPETISAWSLILNRRFPGRRVAKIVVTHLHRDHLGMAGWLSRTCGTRLYMTRLEYLHARLQSSQALEPPPPSYLLFYGSLGWDAAAIEHYVSGFGRHSALVSVLPDAYRRIADGDVIRLGRDLWTVITGGGHSPEHACLYSQQHNLLISGDQILPDISSNVSVHPFEPDADPLKDWLESLRKLIREVPRNVLVLPAHGRPFIGLHDRADYMIVSRERSLARVEDLLDEPRPMSDVFEALFIREITPDIVGLATGEALAHLNHLIHRGRVTRRQGQDGRVLYQRVTT